MKKVQTTKLNLRGETLRVLQDARLATVAGGCVASNQAKYTCVDVFTQPIAPDSAYCY